MLTQAVIDYLAVRRATGFALRCKGFQLKSFAAFSEAREKRYVSSDVAIQWAGWRDRFRSVPVASGPSSDSPDIFAPRTNVMKCLRRFSASRSHHGPPHIS